MNRIGFACMILDDNGQVLEGTRMRTTTVAHFSKLTEREKQDKITELSMSNVLALENQVKWLVRQPEIGQFMRITSDLLPLYTYPGVELFYSNCWNMIETILIRTGKLARQFNIRLTSHPAQFCVLNSFDNKITQNTVRELEYHAMVFNIMGLSFLNGSVINIHAGKKDNGLDQLVENAKMLSKSCREMLSIETDEFSFGIDDFIKVKLYDQFHLVIDIHHHWINTGKYILANDPCWEFVKQSWHGIVPKIHVSSSPEELVKDLELNELGLHIAPSEKRAKLRVHSDMIWFKKFRDYTLTFLQHGDLMIESKAKNLASEQLYREIIKL